MKTRVERRTRFARPVGSGRALRGRTSSWRVRCRPRTAGFRFRAAHHAASGRRHSWTTRERTPERRAPVSRPPPRAAARLRVARLRSRARPFARIRTRRRLGRTLELAKTARARTRERRSHARARRTRGVRGGRLRGEGRVEAFRGSADASALPETGDTARRASVQRFPAKDSSATVRDRPP
jgi:hypothetical protein